VKGLQPLICINVLPAGPALDHRTEVLLYRSGRFHISEIICIDWASG
jgi:hypothetical protein